MILAPNDTAQEELHQKMTEKGGQHTKCQHPSCRPAIWAPAALEHEMKMASSRNIPCWYQRCALDAQEPELISHGSVKMRSTE
jgi:hypothetical protein